MTQLSAAQKIELLDVVERFYPRDRLTNAFDPSERLSSYEILVADGNQPSVILAAYTDRTNGAVRAMRRNAAGTWDLAYDSPDTLVMNGRGSQVGLRDLDLDTLPETAFVSFFGARASSAWVFRWDGNTLANLTPTQSTN